MVIEGEDYLKYVDEGRKPGKYPNIGELKKWARIKGIPDKAVFPIANSIFRFGIKPTHILQKTNTKALTGAPIKNLESNVAENLEDIIVKELENLNNK